MLCRWIGDDFQASIPTITDQRLDGPGRGEVVDPMEEEGMGELPRGMVVMSEEEILASVGGGR